MTTSVRERLAALPGAALATSTVPILIGALAIGLTFPGWSAPATLAAACLATVLVMTLGAVAAMRRAVMPAIVIVGVLALAVVAMATAPRLAADALAPTPAWRLLFDAVPHLLTTPRGTPPRLDLLAPLIVAVVVAQTIVTSRTMARGRGRSGLAPLIGGAALYGIAAVLSAGAFDRQGVIAAVLVVAVLGGWLGRRPSMAVTGMLLVVAVAATVVAGIGFAPGRDIRAVITPPTVVVRQPNVVPYLAEWADQSDLPVATIAGDVPDRVDLAVYPRFNGNSWSSGPAFALAGSRAAGQLPTATLHADYRMTVKPGDLPLDWLLSAGTVTGVSLPDALVDLTGGGVVRLGEQTARLPYSIHGRVDVADDATLAAAGVPSIDAAAPYLQVPALPDSLRTWVDRNVRPYVGRFYQATALEAALRDGRTADSTDSGSTSLSSIADLVTKPHASASPATFASAFAVLARSVGLPTRLVIGARLSDRPGVTSMQSRTIRTGDLSVWPEVYFSGAGWVAFDPTPGDNPQQVARQEALSAAGRPQAPTPAPPPPPADHASGSVSHGPDLGVVLTALAALALLGLVGAVGAGVVARRRIARAGARGAYSLVESAAVLAGLPLTPASTADDVAGCIAAAAGPEHGAAAARIARAAQRESWAPGAATRTDRDLWRGARGVRRALRRRAGIRARISWPLRPVGFSRRPLARRGYRSMRRSSEAPARVASAE